MMLIAESSVQSLFLQMCFSGTCLGSGTGFVANSARGPVLITNWHNVTGRHPVTDECLHPMGGTPDEIVITHNSSEEPGRWCNKTEPLFNGNTPRWIEHPKWGRRVDFVALPLTQLDGVALYPYDLVNTGTPIFYGPSDSVSVIGFPFGIRVDGSTAIWATGFVASEPQLDYENLPLFLIDCRGRPGQSGSPVIAYRSGGMIALEGGFSSMFGGPIMRLLGIYSGRINEQSDLGLVWKVSAIRELVDSIA